MKIINHLINLHFLCSNIRHLNFKYNSLLILFRTDLPYPVISLVQIHRNIIAQKTSRGEINWINVMREF